MGKSLHIAEAIATMNRFGARRTPFLMFCNYAQTENYVIPLSDVDPAEIIYDILGITNAPQLGPIAPLSRWQVTPPTFEKYEQSAKYVIGQANAGNTYLANLTFPSGLQTNLGLREMFFAFRAKFKLHFHERFTVFSPEPFVKIEEDGRISTFPMKGTIGACIPDAEDVLMNNAKEAAEHATIVDLMRNDLSLVADEVSVPRFRYLERIPSPNGDILQTSSEVSGQLFPYFRRQLGTVLYSLLPAGSITGAPKPKTQEIIAQAEEDDRGFYTGVFGLFDGHTFQSAVAIRFVEQTPEGDLRIRTGGGITAQSNPKDEYAELVLKTQPPVG